MICCVGVGPGDLGFLTRRGQELIEGADVVAGFTAVADGRWSSRKLASLRWATKTRWNV